MSVLKADKNVYTYRNVAEVNTRIEPYFDGEVERWVHMKVGDRGYVTNDDIKHTGPWTIRQIQIVALNGIDNHLVQMEFEESRLVPPVWYYARQWRPIKDGKAPSALSTQEFIRSSYSSDLTFLKWFAIGVTTAIVLIKLFQ